MVSLIVKVNVGWLCCGRCSFADFCAESNRWDELRKLGHGPGGYCNAVEDYWPWPGRSLKQAQPLFNHGQVVLRSKASKSCCRSGKVIMVSASSLQA